MTLVAPDTLRVEVPPDLLPFGNLDAQQLTSGRNRTQVPAIAPLTMPDIADRFSHQVHACMEALARCHTTCLSMVMTHCFELGGEHTRPQHIRLMLDCSTICAATADLLAHKSQFHSRVCALCADICEVCSEDCERLGQMEECVMSCRRCLELCRETARLGHTEILGMASMLPPGR